jgi:hypothetical protein
LLQILLVECLDDTFALKASQTVPASLAIKSMTFMDREVFETESSTIFTDIRRPSLICGAFEKIKYEAKNKVHPRSLFMKFSNFQH